MSASGRLRVGVIGVGVQGQKHIECFQAAHNATVTAICDANESLLKDRAKQYGIAGTYTDYREMLREAEVDAVAIVLPDHLHRTVCEAAFGAGKHVLLEKPMATTVEDAEAIVAAQKRAGTKLMINWSNRWMPAFAGGKAALDAGKLGEPLYIYARLSNTLYVPTKMLSWSAGTRLPHWLICHRFDIARWYLGCEAKRVRAVCGSRVLREIGIDTPDFYQATIEFENGVVGNFESCWVLPETLPFIVDSKFQMVCTKGYVNVDPLLPVSVVASDQTATYGTPLFADVMGRPQGFVFDAICHFVDSVLAGREPLITGVDGLAITRAMCAIVESAETGKAVEL
jgi:predicted dehydrogenase